MLKINKQKTVTTKNPNKHSTGKMSTRKIFSFVSLFESLYIGSFMIWFRGCVSVWVCVLDISIYKHCFCSESYHYK